MRLRRRPSNDLHIITTTVHCHQPKPTTYEYNHCLPFYHFFSFLHYRPSVLWHSWSGGRKGIRPVKNWVVGCWHGYLSEAWCRLAYGPADTTATRCLLSCFSKIQIGFTFLVPAHPGSPGQRAIKWVCVCMCVLFCINCSEYSNWQWCRHTATRKKCFLECECPKNCEGPTLPNSLNTPKSNHVFFKYLL